MNRVNTERHSLINCSLSCRTQMLERKKNYFSTTENTKALPNDYCSRLLATLIQPQNYNDKHDGSGDQNIDKVVDLYFKICVVFLLLVRYLIPQFYL